MFSRRLCLRQRLPCGSPNLLWRLCNKKKKNEKPSKKIKLKKSGDRKPSSKLIQITIRIRINYGIYFLSVTKKSLKLQSIDTTWVSSFGRNLDLFLFEYRCRIIKSYAERGGLSGRLVCGGRLCLQPLKIVKRAAWSQLTSLQNELRCLSQLSSKLSKKQLVARCFPTRHIHNTHRLTRY